jgi:hypothetical protein
VNDDLVGKCFAARAGNYRKVRRIRIAHKSSYHSPPVMPTPPSCQAGIRALRACIPKAAFTPCRQVRKRRLAYAAGSARHVRRTLIQFMRGTCRLPYIF